jgi:hypothetical protein
LGHTVYDELPAQIRNVQRLSLDANNYEPMLVPVLMSKLPEEMKLIISREFNSQQIYGIFRKYLMNLKAKFKLEKYCVC